MSSTAKSLIILRFFFELQETTFVQNMNGDGDAIETAALVGQPGYEGIASDADEVK
jgi:hypothetical protein